MHFSAFAVYAPTEASQDRDKDEFYEQLNEVINEAPILLKLILKVPEAGVI